MTDQLTANFARSEFACAGTNCCNHSAPVHIELVQRLQQLRDLINTSHRSVVEHALHVNSGFRCIKHNSQTKGAAANSYHTLGLAADISCKTLSVLQLYNAACEIFVSVGIYDGRIHVDIRDTLWHPPAHWDKRTIRGD